MLPSEKIKFGSNSIVSNRQADWGREAVKESVITPVSALSLVCNCCKCKRILTESFVSPSGGFEFLDMCLHQTRSEQSIGLHPNHEESHSSHGHWGKINENNDNDRK